ncbi:multisubstrate pseudouridine synthase 7 [Collariella sp. IMI 366227]|nr:multisubstrate pseudouridine synthase 7 [Collariella sp. IMI 366227]
MSQRPGTHVPAVRAETEKTLGITQRSAAIDFAWTGDIRKRYTDFLVNEIRKDGTVLHLRDFEESEVAIAQSQQTLNDRKPSAANLKTEEKPKVKSLSDDERKAVVDLLGESVAQKLIELDENVQAKKQMAPQERTITFDAVSDRAKRSVIHQEIRRIFHSRIETVADSAGIIKAAPARWALNSRASGQTWGRRDNNRFRDQGREYADLGGEYLHLTLYKENKDTMDAVNTIARLLKVKASNFGFAGTKDRRAGTVQRISVYRQKASNLIWLNTRIPNVKVGDFEYSKDPLQLGQHGGNEFVITLKNCEPLTGGENLSLVQRMKMIQKAVESGLTYLKTHGYINYYGLQRFGTYTIGTHLLGMKILRGDYEGFIDDVLHVDDDLMKEVLSNVPPTYGTGKDFQNSRDDQNRARAITTWKTTKNAQKALEFLPKRFSSETAIIRHLGKNQKDFTGAVLSITRGMRMMYIHAYQSYVWNYAATLRWSKFGAKVIEGDLVLVTGSRCRDNSDDEEFNPYDDNDDNNIYAQAQPLTAADVASGKYSIFDVVLPTPGFDVLYPRNEIGDFYAEFMGRPENGSLSPFDMRRKQREFSLSGNYRPLIGRLIGEPQCAVRAYRDDLEQMYPTDLDYALQKKNAEKAAKLQAQQAKAQANSAIDRWSHFARNPTVYDQAIDGERRRKADEEPPRENLATVTNETWIQTCIDGSSKRVKVARHHQQIENQSNEDAAHGDTSPTNPSVKVEDTNEDSNSTPFPVGNGVSLTEDSQAASPSRILTDGPFPMIPLPEGAIPASGIRGVSDSYYAETGKIPYFGPLPGTEETVAAADTTQAQQPVFEGEPKPFGLTLSDITNTIPNTADNKPGDAIPAALPPLPPAPLEQAKSALPDMMDWYGTNLPQLPTMDLVKAEVEDADDVERVNGVRVTKLHTASDNPLSSGADEIDEASITQGADKIAVILKFQLKSSNYATIVLRELMGTTAE